MRENDNRSRPVQEDMRFQYVWWVAERVAWVIIGLVPLAALTGLFSHGVLSESRASAPDAPLTVHYERFQRQTALSRFIAHIPSGGSNELRLRLSPSFQEAFEIESIQPQPVRSTAGAEGMEFFFRPPAAGELIAIIWTRPRQFGLIPLQAEGDRGGPAAFTVMVYH